MKKFKKFIASRFCKVVGVAAIAGFALVAKAQPHHEINFLAPVTSIVVSNTLSWTNLNTVAVGATTNVNGLIYTNLLGNQVVVTNGDTSLLSVDVPLWSDRNGMPPVMFIPPTNTVYNGILSAMNLNVHFSRCGSGVSTTAINIIFVPLPDGVHESTQSADLWTVGVTPAAGATVDLSTNMPIWQWAGCKALRLRSITSTRGAANGDVAVDSITVNGFVP